jgi:hypothetical protein
LPEVAEKFLPDGSHQVDLPSGGESAQGEDTYQDQHENRQAG